MTTESLYQTRLNRYVTTMRNKNPELVQRIWDEIEGLANHYIWQLLLAA